MAVRHALLVLLCLAPALAAHAAADPQQGACAPDAARLCGGDVSNVARTAACLVAHRAKLSPTCRDVFAFAEPAAYGVPAKAARPVRVEAAATRPGRPHVAHAHLARRYRPHLVRRAPYHIPRFDQAEAEAEVHTQYRYRTPYLPYWVFP